jgi:hypothetical protein
MQPLRPHEPRTPGEGAKLALELRKPSLDLRAEVEGEKDPHELSGKNAIAQGRTEIPDLVLSGSSFASLRLCAFAFFLVRQWDYCAT